MNTFRRLPWISLIVLTGCATVPTPVVRCEFPSDSDFSELKTYAWPPNARPVTGDPRVSNRHLQERVQSAADSYLQAKGFTKVPAAEADFWMAYLAIVKDREGARSTYKDNLYGVNWSWEEAATVPERELKEGALLLGVVDPQEKRLIWHGWMEAALKLDVPDEQKRARMNQAVAEILAMFPPSTAGTNHRVQSSDSGVIRIERPASLNY